MVMNSKNEPYLDVSSIGDSLKMLGDRILLVPSDEDGERATRGGLVIPATANNERRLKWGKVISVGPNTRNIGNGDSVLYSPESGFEVEIHGDPYLILRERDIHATASQDSELAPGPYL
jgi:chaperonin GroES